MQWELGILSVDELSWQNQKHLDDSKVNEIHYTAFCSAAPEWNKCATFCLGQCHPVSFIYRWTINIKCSIHESFSSIRSSMPYVILEIMKDKYDNNT